MAELQAQLNKARHLGFHISYIDSHMMFEWAVPGLNEKMTELAHEENMLYHQNYNQGLPDIREAEGDPVEQFLTRLEAAAPCQYLFVTHPAIDSPEMRQLGNENEKGMEIATTRDWDIRLLTDERVVSYMNQKGIVPIRYDQASSIS